MAITKAKKAEVIEGIKARIAKAGSVVFVNFHKLPVSDSTTLRGTLRKDGSGYMVAKKTLLARVLDAQGIEGSRPELAGEVAFVYGPDQVVPSKDVADFAKTHKENFAILGGILEGRYISAAEVSALAKTPSREVLYTQLVGVLSGPARGLVTALSGVPRGFVRALDQIAQKKSA